MSRDIIMIGAIIGLLADAVKLLVNFILYLMNYTNVVFWQITATHFLEKKDLFNPAAYVIGGVADITVTAALGVLFVAVIYFTGKRYLWIKGIGFGLFVWVSLFGTFLGQSVQAKLPQEPSGIMVTIVAHFVFGLGLAGLTQYLYQPQVNNDDQNSFFPIPARKIFVSELNQCAKESSIKKNKKPSRIRGLLKAIMGRARS